MSVLRIGTRGSPLALWQARAVQSALTAAGGPATEIVTIRTTGDRLSQAVLTEVGGKAVFVKEIEEALIGHTVDLAVHSAKDLPSVVPDGLGIAAVLPRADPRDVLVVRAADAGNGSTAASILSPRSSGPRVGTGSVRRIAQLARRYPDARFEPIRGNVDTRLRRLDDGAYDVIVLAAAGLDRLGLGERIAVRLPLNECVPAPGQGIVAIETREHDEETRAALALIDHATTRSALEAERAVLTTLGGDCHVPIGAVSTTTGDDIVVDAIVASPDGATLLAHRRRGPRTQSERVGRQVAQDLIEDGALAVIADGRPSERPRDTP